MSSLFSPKIHLATLYVCSFNICTMGFSLSLSYFTPHTLPVSLKVGNFKPLGGVVINNPGCFYFPLELKKVRNNQFYGVVVLILWWCDGVSSVVAVPQAGSLWSGDRCCSYGDKEDGHHSLACPGLPLPPSLSIIWNLYIMLPYTLVLRRAKNLLLKIAKTLVLRRWKTLLGSRGWLGLSESLAKTTAFQGIQTPIEAYVCAPLTPVLTGL